MDDIIRKIDKKYHVGCYMGREGSHDTLKAAREHYNRLVKDYGRNVCYIEMERVETTTWTTTQHVQGGRKA